MILVGKVCDEGHTVVFSDKDAIINGKDGSQLAKFSRNAYGLYIAKLTLRRPSGLVGHH